MALGRAQAYHNLAVLLEAGVPAEKSFRTAAAGARGRLAGGFAAVADGALAGRGLAETMATHPEAFAVLDRVLVEVSPYDLARGRITYRCK